MALSKRYACLNNLGVALAALKEGDLEEAENRLSEAASDPELDKAMEEVEAAQVAAETASKDEEEEDCDAPDVEVEVNVDESDDDEDEDEDEEEASLMARVDARVKRNIAAL